MAYKVYVCTLCGFVYSEEAGRSEDGLEPGTLWGDIPEDWICPDCAVQKKEFIVHEN